MPDKETRVVRFFKRQRRDFHQVQLRDARIHAIRKGERVRDRRTHIGVAELRSTEPSAYDTSE